MVTASPGGSLHLFSLVRASSLTSTQKLRKPSMKTSDVVSCTKPRQRGCGLFGATRPSYLQRRLANGAGVGYIVDVERFHEAVRGAFSDYLKELVNPDHGGLRENLWRKMDHICGVRQQRAGFFG